MVKATSPTRTSLARLRRVNSSLLSLPSQAKKLRRVCLLFLNNVPTSLTLSVRSARLLSLPPLHRKKQTQSWQMPNDLISMTHRSKRLSMASKMTRSVTHLAKDGQTSRLLALIASLMTMENRLLGLRLLSTPQLVMHTMYLPGQAKPRTRWIRSGLAR